MEKCVAVGGITCARAILPKSVGTQEWMPNDGMTLLDARAKIIILNETGFVWKRCTGGKQLVETE